MSPAKNHRDLVVWQKSKDLTIFCYGLAKNLPLEERFALASQIKRAAASVPANIAEGFGRYAKKDKEHFYIMARGSLYELDTHIQIAYELGYIAKVEHEQFLDRFRETSRILSGFLKTHQS